MDSNEQKYIMHKQNLSKNVCVWKTQCDFSIAIVCSTNACVRSAWKTDRHTQLIRRCVRVFLSIYYFHYFGTLHVRIPTQPYSNPLKLCADNWLCANDSRQFHFYCSRYTTVLFHISISAFLHVTQKNRFTFLLKCTHFGYWNRMVKYERSFFRTDQTKLDVKVQCAVHWNQDASRYARKNTCQWNAC